MRNGSWISLYIYIYPWWTTHNVDKTTRVLTDNDDWKEPLKVKAKKNITKVLGTRDETQVFEFHWLIHLLQITNKPFHANHAKVLLSPVVQFCLLLSTIFLKQYIQSMHSSYKQNWPKKLCYLLIFKTHLEIQNQNTNYLIKNIDIYEREHQ